ncbi:Hypothetical_protein [Hexamita inflata]|uniref:Hypothetical_protein n=1 Tax=Hexamita inflata TaxID=28002 RepID=A0AA86UVS6_9EUKA|nr:Hypothetical protein HINF_LOCUS54437 [Hexamita inflata]
MSQRYCFYDFKSFSLEAVVVFGNVYIMHQRCFPASFDSSQAARTIIIKIVSWLRFSLFRVQLNVLTHYLYVTRALYSTSTNERTKATRRYQAAVNASGALRSSQDFPNTGVKQFYVKPQHSFARILFKMKQHCAILTARARKQPTHFQNRVRRYSHRHGGSLQRLFLHVAA